MLDTGTDRCTSSYRLRSSFSFLFFVVNNRKLGFVVASVYDSRDSKTVGISIIVSLEG